MIKKYTIKHDKKPSPLSGNKRSHALNHSRRKWNLNLKKETLLIDGKKQTVYISVRDLRALKHRQTRNANSAVAKNS